MSQKESPDRYAHYPQNPSDCPLESMASGSSQTPEEVDIEQALTFMEHVFGDNETIVCIATAMHGQAKPGSHGKPPLTDFRSKFFQFPSEKAEIAKYAVSSAKAGRHVFICVHGLTESERKKIFADKVSCLWADMDSGEPPKSGPEPTMTVESSPGKSHLYFRLTRPIDPQEAETFNKRLARVLGADASGYDLSQLLRLPGTYNYYYRDGEGKPPRVDIFRIASHKTYSPEYLDRVLPPLPEVTKSGSLSSGKDQRSKVLQQTRVFSDPDREIVKKLSGQTLRIFKGESPSMTDDGRVDRSRSLFRIAVSLCEELTQQISEADIRRILPDVLAERDAALGWNKYLDRPEQYEILIERCLDRQRTSG